MSYTYIENNEFLKSIRYAIHLLRIIINSCEGRQNIKTLYTDLEDLYKKDIYSYVPMLIKDVFDKIHKNPKIEHIEIQEYIASWIKFENTDDLIIKYLLNVLDLEIMYYYKTINEDTLVSKIELITPYTWYKNVDEDEQIKNILML